MNDLATLAASATTAIASNLPAGLEAAQTSRALVRRPEPTLAQDLHARELHDLFEKLRRRSGDPSYRAISRRVPVSVSGLSRFFTGQKLLPLDILLPLAKALDASEQDLERCRVYWEAAYRARELTRRARLAEQEREEPAEGQIIIHSGTVYIGDATAAGGKTIVIYAGDVYLTNAAANAAAQVVVHGGTVHLGAEPDNTQHECALCGAWVIDEAQHQTWHDGVNPTQVGAHLRRVR
jgi:hypothetical protein